MVSHTSLPSETEFAMKILEDEYDFFNKSFNQFFPEMICFVELKGDFKIKRPLFKTERWSDMKSENEDNLNT